MRLRLVLYLTALFVTTLNPQPSLAQTDSPFDTLKFLVGDWIGEGSGSPGQLASASASFKYDLDKKVIIRKNRAEFAPKAGEKTGAVHEDLMIIYQQTGEVGLRAIFFDNEGHTINYKVLFPARQASVAFESDASERAPRFRLVQELTPTGDITSDFLIAPPGGEFKSYVKGVMKRKK